MSYEFDIVLCSVCYAEWDDFSKSCSRYKECPSGKRVTVSVAFTDEMMEWVVVRDKLAAGQHVVKVWAR